MGRVHSHRHAGARRFERAHGAAHRGGAIDFIDRARHFHFVRNGYRKNQHDFFDRTRVAHHPDDPFQRFGARAAQPFEFVDPHVR